MVLKKCATNLRAALQRNRERKVRAEDSKNKIKIQGQEPTFRGQTLSWPRIGMTTDTIFLDLSRQNFHNT